MPVVPLDVAVSFKLEVLPDWLVVLHEYPQAVALALILEDALHVSEMFAVTVPP